ncbi:Cell division cycle protein-like protein [Melia azedarach]|uniref:Cell division cycle protein-like protein n=1 Tax=Melia azedarach TaxID=155640 RepID=A0ACC1Y462_MELAZ|nr:Cell division cycle protein-like protein [Melia azedarach]
MASKNSSSLLLILFIFSMVLSSMLPCEAARFTNNGLSGVLRVLQQETSPPIFCPACLCCAPAPPGECCPCFCSSSSSSSSVNLIGTPQVKSILLIASVYEQESV